MSVRSAGRGSAAARSIRLALRSLSIVATKSANFLRCVLRCRGSRRPSSASIPTASRAIPLMLHARQVDHGPRAARPLDSVNETDGWQGRPALDGERPTDYISVDDIGQVTRMRGPIL